MRGAREANGSVTVAERNEEIADLVRRAQAGDRRAFDALFSLHETLALRVAFLITTDVELARDATQEAFLRAYRQIRSLRDPAAFRAWFARIVSTTSQRRNLSRGVRHFSRLGYCRSVGWHRLRNGTPVRLIYPYRPR